MKKAFNILLFASFVFLFIYLLKQDYIIPAIYNYTNLLLSFIFLFLGFIVSAFSWKTALSSHGVNIRAKEAIISHGQAIFSKYIPGKIWVILGRAGYISDDAETMKINSVISFKEQIIYLWVGFLVSSIPTILFYKTQWISVLVLMTIVVLSVILFSIKVNKLVQSLLNKVFRMETEIPVLKLKESLPMILAVSLIWVCWTFGFYLFSTAFSPEVLPIMMFAFPLSVCFGLLAVIAPGGLGVREGIIIGYLVMASMDVETASTISFFNRFWFIIGEVFIFLLALSLRIGSKRR